MQRGEENMLCADSDLIIDFLKRRSDAVEFLEKHEITTTIISCYEVLMGPRPGTKRHTIALELLKSLNIFSYDWDSMNESAKISQELISKGKHIGDFDEMIAGICLANDLTLVTRNKKYFSKIKGLKIKSW